MASNGNEHGLFWGSNNGDRKYNAESFERWLKKFFTTGVFNGDLQVVESSGMTVSVGTGYANLDGKVRFYDTNTLLTLSPANSTYPRIDTIVMTRDNVNRDISLEVITGAYSGSTPSATAPVRDVETFQIVLAEIYVEHGVTEITQAQITDKRQDTSVCGYIVGTVTEMDFSQFAAQFESYYEQFEETNAADFESWFQNLQDELDSNQAAHLQAQIGNLNDLETPDTTDLVRAINSAGHPMLNDMEEVMANNQAGKVADALVTKEIVNDLSYVQVVIGSTSSPAMADCTNPDSAALAILNYLASYASQDYVSQRYMFKLYDSNRHCFWAVEKMYKVGANNNILATMFNVSGNTKTLYEISRDTGGADSVRPFNTLPIRVSAFDVRSQQVSVPSNTSYIYITDTLENAYHKLDHVGASVTFGTSQARTTATWSSQTKLNASRTSSSGMVVVLFYA